MILIFDLFETLIRNNSMDFNRALVHNYHCNNVEPEKGIEEALKCFTKMGIPMYALSNSGFSSAAVSGLLENLGLRQYFTDVFSSADFGKTKPSKEFFELAINRALEDNPWEEHKDIFFVGDLYDNDVGGVLGAGITPIWINSKPADSGADSHPDYDGYEVESTEYLCPLVKKIYEKMTFPSLLETTLNTRDLGGYEVRDGRVTKKLVILRSDRQAYPSENDMFFLKKNNITTIIDMRDERDVELGPSGFANKEDFTYLNIPIVEGSAVPPSVEAVPRSYMDIAHSVNMHRVFDAIADAKGGVMFNCFAGKDRSGVVSALLLTLCGVKDEDIVDNYLLTKICNKNRFKLVRKNRPEIDINIVIPRKSFMQDFLKMLYDKYEYIEDYFEAIGVKPDTVRKIKEKMLGEDKYV